MNAIDPQLMRLREVEARLAFAEFHVQDQVDLVRSLAARGYDTTLANLTLDSMRQTIAVFQQRQEDILRTLDPVSSGWTQTCPASLETAGPGG